jgi:hypothetical protein
MKWDISSITGILLNNFCGAPAKPGKKNEGDQKEGEEEGGCGGNSASPEPKRSVKILRSDFRGKKFGFRSAFGAKLYVLYSREIEKTFQRLLMS